MIGLLYSDINERIDTVKMFLYKNYPKILAKIDFDDDEAFSNPLLYAFLRHKAIGTFSEDIEEEMLGELLQGYFLKNEKLQIKHLYNFEGIAYLPNIGYFKENEEEQYYPITKTNVGNIEILRCTSPLLKFILDIPTDDQKWNDKLYSENIGYINKAMSYIKTSLPEHFKLIESCCKLIYLFDTKDENFNSFASGNSLGAVYFNIYQPEYEEVFFIDDIAHQTGHVIMNNLMFKPNSFYKIDQRKSVKSIINQEDHRDINVLVHALYTYYTTFICLDACINSNCLNSNQIKEAKARIGFYMRKCSLDLEIFDKVKNKFHSIENMFTEKGLEIIQAIILQFNKMKNMWSSEVNEYDYSNQDYNFSMKKFLELNT